MEQIYLVVTGWNSFVWTGVKNQSGKKDSTCECQVQEILKKYQTPKYIRTWNRQAINFTGKLTLKEAQLRKAREELLEAIYKIANCDHEIDKDGLHKSNTKTDAVSAVSEAPRPENVTQLRSFLGLVNYIITVFYKPVSSDWTIK